MPFGDRTFNFGANIAWFNKKYDHDLSKSLVHGTPHAYDSELIDGYFRHLAFRGIKVVRYWVFERLEGMIIKGYSKTGPVSWPIRITGIHPSLKDNVKDIMEKAKKHKLEMYWCLLNGVEAPKGDMWILRRIISEPAIRSSFIANALYPFLDVLYPYKDYVFAIDLINEPELTELDWQYLKDYISTIAWFVQIRFKLLNFKFKCSVGFQKKETIQNHMSDLQSLDFYDYHEYNSSGDLEKYSDLKLDKDCIIGEFGHKDWLHAIFPDTFENDVDDNEQYATCKNFMINAKDRGYKGCLIWRYSPVGDCHRILDLGISKKETFAELMFRGSFLSAAGSSPIISNGMNDATWKANHERKVWKAIKEFVDNKGPFR